MATCDVCGKDENMPYQCRMCGSTHCAEHRLPENHACPGLNEWNDPDGVFGSGFDDSVQNEGRTFSVNTGPGGPLGYFRGNMTYVFLALMWLTFAAQLVVGPVLGMELLANQLFLLKSDAIYRVWTWVTSIFAHGGPTHIFLNSIVLYFFGPPVEKRVGSKKFAALFLVSGAVAGLAQVGVYAVMNPNAVIPASVVGASGAIAAVMGVLTVLNPNLRIYLYFFIPMPLWVATLGFAVYSAFVSVTGGIGAGGVAQLAHLTGLGVGLLYGAKLKREGQSAPEQLQFGGGGGGGRMGGPGRGRF